MYKCKCKQAQVAATDYSVAGFPCSIIQSELQQLIVSTALLKKLF